MKGFAASAAAAFAHGNPADIGIPTSQRILQLRQALGLSQEEFAKRLGVTRIAALRWEKGQEPSFEVYVRLALLAKSLDPSTALWFYSKAGVNIYDFKDFVPAINKAFKQFEERLGDTMGSVRPLYIFEDPAHQQKTEPSEELLFDGALIPHPNTTFAVRARDNRMAPLFREGDLIVVDKSVVSQAGHMILAYHDREEGRWGKGLHIGWLRHFAHSGKQLSVLDQLETRRELESHYAARGDAFIEDAAAELRGDRGWVVLGSVVWWLASSGLYTQRRVPRAEVQ